MKAYVVMNGDPMVNFDMTAYADMLHFEWGQNMPDGSWVGIARIKSADALARLRADSTATILPGPLSPAKLTQKHADKLKHIKAKAGDSPYDTANALLAAHGYPGFDPEAP